MVKRDYRWLLNVGDVVYFIRLHLQTVRKLRRHPRHENEWIYEVEGKPRPMVILKKEERKDRGRWWFRVVPLTTKVAEGRSVTPLGQLLESGRNSYAENVVLLLPDTMIHEEDGRPKKKETLSTLEYGRVLSILNFKMLHSDDRRMS